MKISDQQAHNSWNAFKKASRTKVTKIKMSSKYKKMGAEQRKMQLFSVTFH
uniref:Uncharacterized protein n=1 Tax=Rhizophora mucronata TaxID=61149 RepID=A0A2P2IWC8_RHIMU